MGTHRGIERKSVLITVKAYPLPSRSYDELVCTAGITDGGEWIRIYPVPFRFLRDAGQYRKYQWVDLDLKKAKKDFRPESHSPADNSLEDMDIIETVDTNRGWRKRKELVLERGPKIYTSMTELIEDSKEPRNVSLVTFKSARIIGFEFEEEREWSEKFKKNIQQQNLFKEKGGRGDRDTVRKLPFKFYYKFEDENGKSPRMMIEDWEIGQLFWKMAKKHEGDEGLAIEDVRKKYFDDFARTKDLYFYLGTTQIHHFRAPNPFVIIGTFHPPKTRQTSLF